MEALSAALVVVGLAALAFLRDRDRRRHGWRVEMLEKRAAAWRGDELEALKARVAKLELRGLR